MLGRRLALALAGLAAALSPPDGAAGSAAATDPGPYLGVLFVEEAIDLDAAAPGKVAAMLARPGDRVRRGDVLARFDEAEARQLLAGAEAELEAAGAARERADRELALSHEALARRERAPELFPGEEIGRAREEERIARASLAMAEAAVRREEAEAARARLALSETALTAPFDGVVAARYAEPGAVVQRGSAILRIVGSRGLWVRFAVPPEEIAALRPGRGVEVRATAGELRLAGSVVRVAPEVDAASGMIFVEATLEEAASPGEVAGLSGRAVKVSLR